jgi:hypothetical protein
MGYEYVARLSLLRIGPVAVSCEWMRSSDSCEHGKEHLNYVKDGYIFY